MTILLILTTWLLLAIVASVFIGKFIRVGSGK